MTDMPSIHKKYEDETRRYYGADKDPLKFPPVVTNKKVAYELAHEVERSLGEIDEAELAKDALRVQRRNRIMGGETDLQTLQDEAMSDRLRNTVVNIERDHARLAPGDFNEDAEQSGAYQQGIGIVVGPPVPPRDTPPTDDRR